MEKISVIVPVYRVEKYLNRCVDSILQQSYRDLEIILVDDGSPDQCGSICDHYAVIDARVVAIHQKNGGLSDARNAGLRIATGEYVGFVDSDDYVYPQMYEKLYETLKNSGADISICNYAYVDEETGRIDERMTGQSPIKNETMNCDQALSKINPLMEGYSYYVTAWNKLYKRSLFEDICFKRGHIHEDEYIVHHLFAKCQRIASIDDVLYIYSQRSGSIMKGPVSFKRIDAVLALLDRYNFFREIHKKKDARNSLRGAMWVMIDLLQRLEVPADELTLSSVKNIIIGQMLRQGDCRLVYLQREWIKRQLSLSKKNSLGKEL